MLERGGDLEQLTSGGGIGGEGSSVVRCLHLTSSSVSRDEPNWTHRSVFERKKSFSKTQFWELRKQIKCSVWVQCRSTTCKAKSWLGDITCWTCPTFAHSDQQSLFLPWFKSKSLKNVNNGIFWKFTKTHIKQKVLFTVYKVNHALKKKYSVGYCKKRQWMYHPHLL